MLAAQIPHSDAIANAFDLEAATKTIEEKYATGAVPLKTLYDEIAHGMALSAAA